MTTTPTHNSQQSTVALIGQEQAAGGLTPGYSPGNSGVPGAPTSALPSGTNPTLGERINDVLWLMGINPQTNPNAVQNLIAQSNFEYPSGPVGNNLFGTSLAINGSKSTNSSGVQSYNTWQDGVYAAALMLSQSNNTAAANSLAANEPINKYAVALGNSSWEGNNPGASAANQSYGQAVLNRYNTLVANGTLQKIASQASSSNQAYSSGGATPDNFGTIPGIFSFLGFNPNWAVVGSVAIGVALIIVGLLFFFHKGTRDLVQTVKSGAVGAAVM